MREWKGQCLCGDVTVVVACDPSWVGHCHCPSCRKVAGSPYTTYARFDDHSVCINGDALKRYSANPGVDRLFCGRCSTPIALRSDKRPGQLQIHAVVFDDAEQLIPQENLYVSTRLEWAAGDSLPECQLFPGMKTKA